MTVTASCRRSHLLQSPDWESPSGAGHFGPGPLFGAEGPCGEKRGRLWWVLPSASLALNLMGTSEPLAHFLSDAAGGDGLALTLPGG